MTGPGDHLRTADTPIAETARERALARLVASVPPDVAAADTAPALSRWRPARTPPADPRSLY